MKRLLGMLELLGATSALARPSALLAQCPDGSPPPCAAARAAPAPLVAVLLFENLTGDTTEGYRAQGLTEELIRQLTRTPGVRAASWSRARRFGTGAGRDPALIARELGADYLVTGSIRRSGATLRVGVELVRPPSATSVWSDRFDRRGDRLLALEDELAAAVAREVLGHVRPRGPPRGRAAVRPEAWDLFLRGTFEMSLRGRSIGRAIAAFTRVVELSPAFGRAHARLAYAYALLVDNQIPYEGLPSESLLARGEASVERARRLASDESDTWLADAYLRMLRSARTFEGVAEAYERAIALDPENAEAHHQYAWALLLLERDSASAAEYRRALAIEPDRWTSMWELGRVHHVRGELREAVAWYDSALARNQWTHLHAQKTIALLSLGDTGAARRSYTAADAGRVAAGQRPYVFLRLMLAAATGDTATRRVDTARLLESVATNPPPANLGVATAMAAIGAVDTALYVLEQLPRTGLMLHATRYPEFDALRNHPRYRRLAAQYRGEMP